MKNVATCMVVVLVLALGSIAAQGQEMLKVNVPFDFAIGETHLASGTYYIQKVGREIEVCTSANGKQTVMFHTIPVEKLNSDPGKYALDFNRYGDEYILSQVWTGETGHELRQTAREVRLAKAEPRNVATIAMETSK